MLDKLMGLWKELWDSHGQTLSSKGITEPMAFGKFMGGMIKNTPSNLDKAFAMRNQLQAPDTMTGISDTAVRGAGGTQQVKDLLNQLGK